MAATYLVREEAQFPGHVITALHLHIHAVLTDPALTRVNAGYSAERNARRTGVCSRGNNTEVQSVIIEIVPDWRRFAEMQTCPCSGP